MPILNKLTADTFDEQDNVDIDQLLNQPLPFENLPNNDTEEEEDNTTYGEMLALDGLIPHNIAFYVDYVMSALRCYDSTIFTAITSLYHSLLNSQILTINNNVKYWFVPDNILLLAYTGRDILKFTFIMFDRGSILIKATVDNRMIQIMEFYDLQNVKLTTIATATDRKITTYPPRYLPIPGAPGYSYDRLKPTHQHIRGPTQAQIFKPQNLPYYRLRLGRKMLYLHDFLAYAYQLPNYEMLRLTKTRQEYYQMLRDGSLYVIDHIDNNPSNNEIWNLQIMTQSDNLRRRNRGRN